MTAEKSPQEVHELATEVIEPERKPARRQKNYSFPDSQRSVHLAVPPTTTEQEDLTTAGQRKVNLIWEYTQAAIAIMIVLTCVIVAAVLAIREQGDKFPVILSSLVMLVIGFYFSRTNHAAIGGTGKKPQEEYKGR
jgi:hypothetical protein